MMQRYRIQCRHGRQWRTQDDVADLAEALADAELLRWEDHPSRVWDAVTGKVVGKVKGLRRPEKVCL